mmetsp:Transcript_22572/g.62355  ORF Transcript_22572/g.62355 Transcript_22572/m.62355 type:complete len:114 (-) Transcript_22572:1306-1647(-)
MIHSSKCLSSVQNSRKELEGSIKKLSSGVCAQQEKPRNTSDILGQAAFKALSACRSASLVHGSWLSACHSASSLHNRRLSQRVSARQSGTPDQAASKFQSAWLSPSSVLASTV